ncbi:MAG: hypothetical protein KJ886_00920 [Candidatus Thermoplasmatota archaeon]|nr:hypothetical protein [Candidatus Thermoplasmatota archaeon]MCG2826336.1 hypothetical protein [Thermoplasmatales archaeon]
MTIKGKFALPNNRKKIFNTITWFCVALGLFGIFGGIAGMVIWPPFAEIYSLGVGLFLLLPLSVCVWCISYLVLRFLPLHSKSALVKNMPAIITCVIAIGLIILIVGSVLVVKAEKEREEKVTNLRGEIYKLRSRTYMLEAKNPDNWTENETIEYITNFVVLTGLEWEIDQSFKPVFDAMEILVIGNLITILGIVAHLFRSKEQKLKLKNR